MTALVRTTQLSRSYGEALALDDVSDFIVIDRAGPGHNCDEITIEPGVPIVTDAG